MLNTSWQSWRIHKILFIRVSGPNRHCFHSLLPYDFRVSQSSRLTPFRVTHNRLCLHDIDLNFIHVKMGFISMFLAEQDSCVLYNIRSIYGLENTIFNWVFVDCILWISCLEKAFFSINSARDCCIYVSHKAPHMKNC